MRRRPARHTPYFEVVEALEAEGCCVCRLVRRRVAHLLESFTYEQVNDIEVRDALRATRGFCAQHARRYVDMPGTVLGAAIVYADVLSAIQRELAEGLPGRGEGNGLLGGIFGAGAGRGRRSDRRCLACREAADAARGYLKLLLEHLEERDFQQRYSTSEGLCLPHLEDALGRARPGAAAVLKQVAAARIGGLLRDLHEVIRKHDYRFNRERIDESEAMAARLAVDLVVGGRAEGEG
jgi:Family of unknown function (DUF6062)